MHWHGRPCDHSAPRHLQVFAGRQLDTLGGGQEFIIDAVMILLPTMVSERGNIVENEAILLRVKLRRFFRVSGAPGGAITIDEPSESGVIAGLLLCAGTNKRQHRASQRRSYV